MDQRVVSSFYEASSFLSTETHHPTERQVGFWKSGLTSDHVKIEGMSSILGNMADVSSPLDKQNPNGAPGAEFLDLSQRHIAKVQKDRLNVKQNFVGAERKSNLSLASMKASDLGLGPHMNKALQPPLFMEGNKVGLDGAHHESSLYSSSLSELFERNLRLSSTDVLFSQSIDAYTSHFEDEEHFESLKEIEAQMIGNLLPDDDDLLSGVIDDVHYHAHGQQNSGDDVEDVDFFSSVGGLELEEDDGLSSYSSNKGSDQVIGGISNSQQGGSNNSLAGEHPFGEHPSRTLFVRNINSSVEDSELRTLFEEYGDIRTLYTSCKHRGFVMISYFDIRSARNAMRALQNKPMRRRKLDIHFSIPKDNPSEKDINQGTLVVFNLDSSVSNEELRQIFGAYGEIKEIRETPHKRHHKFIEFYDVRAAEAALRALNRSDIAGKRIKLEPSRPGGARRCLMQQLFPELETEEACELRQQGSPPDNSPSECFGSVANGTTVSSGLENAAIMGLHSAIRAPSDPFLDTTFLRIPSSLSQSISSPIRAGSVNNHHSQTVHREPSHALGHVKFGFQSTETFHPHSLPDYHHENICNGVLFSSPSNVSNIMGSMNPRMTEGMDNRHIPGGGLSSHSFEFNDHVFGGQPFAWTNPNSYHHPRANSMVWPHSPAFVNGIHAHPHQLQSLPRAPSHMINTVLPMHHQHHVGSAPAINPSPWDGRNAYPTHSIDASAFQPGSLGSIGFTGRSPFHPLDLASRNIFVHGGAACLDPSMSSPNIGMPSPQQRCNMFLGRNSMIPVPSSLDATNERVRSRRNELNSSQAENKKQYDLDIDRIVHGEDTRTTLMIKNIPNKYTSKMLLAAIDENHRGTYDFIYLPIDFKNKCNVGYAFINMIDPSKIVPFFQAFNGKKWEKFNSEKVASLAYARIQGKTALVAHFQNSSLMNEDKRCRPILFHSDGPNAGDQEPFPIGVNIRSRPGKTRTSGNDDDQISPSNSVNGEDSTDSSGSAKDDE